MDPVFLGAMVALGLASGVHCAGMCGGIVSVISILAGAIGIIAAVLKLVF